MAEQTEHRAHELADLITLIQRLRAPDGCPWDQKQTMSSIRAYLIEEAHETAAAIDAENSEQIREELGDLLFQVAFVIRLGEERGAFSRETVVQGIHDKMVARHPHVFPNPETGKISSTLKDVDEVLVAWEAGKIQERGDESILVGVPSSLPALTGAYRLTQKAAGVGFDWPDVDGVLAKVKEELAEVEAAIAAQSADDAESERAVREELGDLLFAVANLGRHLKMDPEAALAQGNLKFKRRFGALEEIFRERRDSLSEAGLEAMDEVWEAVKAEESRRD